MSTINSVQIGFPDPHLGDSSPPATTPALPTANGDLLVLARPKQPQPQQQPPPPASSSAMTTTTTTTTTTTYTYSNHRYYSNASICTLAGLSLFLFCLLLFVIRHCRRTHLARDLWIWLRHAVDYSLTTKSQMQDRISRRYETVEHWLITKRIQPHDAFCTRVCCQIMPNSPKVTTMSAEGGGGEGSSTCSETLADSETTTGTGSAVVVETSQNDTTTTTPTPPPDDDPTPKMTTTARPAVSLATADDSTDDVLFDIQQDDDDDDKECPICMNPLRVNDIVSWSAHPTCQHVYHHECIKEWLLRKTACPCCRETFLPCDEIRGPKKAQLLSIMSKRYASCNSTSYCCAKEGLVQLPPVVRCTLSELELLKKRIVSSALQPSELVTLRGQRAETTCTKVSVKNNHTNHNTDDLELGGAVMGGIEDASENPYLESANDLQVCISVTPATAQQATAQPAAVSASAAVASPNQEVDV